MHKDIKRILIIMLLSITLSQFISIANALAQREKDLGNLVKSAYLIKIIQFIYWPDNINDEEKLQQSSIELCIYGDYFLNSLKVNEDQLNYASKNISISSLKADFIDKNSCDVIYFDASSLNMPTEEAIGFINQNTVTISDRKGFAEQGGMIELKTASTNINIVINMYSVESSQARLSSDLLEVAEIAW